MRLPRQHHLVNLTANVSETDTGTPPAEIHPACQQGTLRARLGQGIKTRAFWRTRAADLLRLCVFNQKNVGGGADFTNQTTAQAHSDSDSPIKKKKIM